MAQVSGSIPVRPTFEFGRSLQFIDVFSPCSGEQRVVNGALEKAVQLGEHTVGFRVWGGRGALQYTLFSAGRIDAALEAAARDRIAFFLSVDDDLAPFFARAARDPAMKGALQRWRGMHHVKFIAPFEIATWAVLGQRNPIPVARRTKDAIVERWGGRVEVDGVELRAFPTAKQWRAIPRAELDAVVNHPRRARFLAAVAEAFEGVDEQFLRGGDFDDVEAWLRDIDGIGEWSSAFVLFRGLGRADRMPLSAPMEVAARRAYGPLGQQKLREISRSYGPHQGYWALYLRA